MLGCGRRWVWESTRAQAVVCGWPRGDGAGCCRPPRTASCDCVGSDDRGGLWTVHLLLSTQSHGSVTTSHWTSNDAVRGQSRRRAPLTATLHPHCHRCVRSAHCSSLLLSFQAVSRSTPASVSSPVLSLLPSSPSSLPTASMSVAAALPEAYASLSLKGKVALITGQPLLTPITPLRHLPPPTQPTSHPPTSLLTLSSLFPPPPAQVAAAASAPPPSVCSSPAVPRSSSPPAARPNPSP